MFPSRRIRPLRHGPGLFTDGSGEDLFVLESFPGKLVGPRIIGSLQQFARRNQALVDPAVVPDRLYFSLIVCGHRRGHDSSHTAMPLDSPGIPNEVTRSKDGRHPTVNKPPIAGDKGMLGYCPQECTMIR